MSVGFFLRTYRQSIARLSTEPMWSAWPVSEQHDVQVADFDSQSSQGLGGGSAQIHGDVVIAFYDEKVCLKMLFGLRCPHAFENDAEIAGRGE